MTNKPELERVCIDCGRDLTTEMGVTVFRRKPGRVDTFESTRELLCVEHGKNGANGRPAADEPTNPRTKVDERTVKFVRLGFAGASLDFTAPMRDRTTLQAALQAIGRREHFDGPAMMSDLDPLLEVAQRIEVGRESSPVLYVHLAAETQQSYVPPASPSEYRRYTDAELIEHAQQVLDWGERMQADALTVRQDSPVGVDPEITRNRPGEQPRCVRLWWD